jgi:uncharacterized protein (TIGR00369 family)
MPSLLSSAPRPPCAETLGWELIAEFPEEGRIEIAFHPNGSMINPRGAIQGGFVAAMLDDVMGPALVTASGDKEAPVSLDMNVTFLRPVMPGRVIGKGRVVSRTKSLAFLEGELFDEQGGLLARATSTAKVFPI